LVDIASVGDVATKNVQRPAHGELRFQRLEGGLRSGRRQQRLRLR
jgi:hypothetical protein